LELELNAKLILLNNSDNDAKPTNHMHDYELLVPSVVAPNLTPWRMAPNSVSFSAEKDGYATAQKPDLKEDPCVISRKTEVARARENDAQTSRPLV
jgi:hypothetical protein